MHKRTGHDDRRLDRRIPIGCPALIHLAAGSHVTAKCMEIGVGGMSLHAAYVPAADEVLDVEVAGPEGGVRQPPLRVRLQVRRCNALGAGLYEIGGAIVRVVG